MAFDSTTALQLLRFDDDFDGSLRFAEPLSRHTTYRIGGPALCWVEADSLTALAHVLEICERDAMPWTIVGKGSNLLVSDAGYRGVAITLGRDFKRWNFDSESMQFTVGAAASLSRIVQEAFHQGVSGLEFAVGTPGTLGGALRMNAGTRTEWLGRQVISVTTYVPGTGLKRYRGSDITWEYRHSSLSKREVIVECVLSVKPGEERFIRAKMEGSLTRRKRSQPLEYPSCGSVFKGVEGHAAGELIEAAGLKGAQVGGAQISPKHANFIVNTGNASAADVLQLMKTIRKRSSRNMASNYNRKSGSSGSRGNARRGGSSGNRGSTMPSSRRQPSSPSARRMPSSAPSKRSSQAGLSRRAQASAPVSRKPARTVRMPQSNPHSKSKPSRSSQRVGASPNQRVKSNTPHMVQMPQTSGRGSARPQQGGYRPSSYAGRPQNRASQPISSVRIGDLNQPRRRDARGGQMGVAYGHIIARIVIILAVIALVAVGFFVLRSTNLFPVQQVRVSGVEHLTSEEMTDLAAVPAGATLINVDAAGIESRLESNPWVLNVQVNRVLPDTLDLAITERTIAAVVTVTGSDKQTENWAIASDGMWLMKIPDQNSDEGKSISQQVYTDADRVLHITDVPYGVKPQEGAYCSDSSVLNALNIVSGLTTSLADEVTTVSATDTVNTILTLDNGVQIAFGTADDIRNKERVCLQLLQKYPDQIAYINVRVVDRPTWRAI